MKTIAEKRYWDYYLSFRDDTWLAESGPTLMRLCQREAELDKLTDRLRDIDPMEEPKLYRDLRTLVQMVDSTVWRMKKSLRLDKQSTYSKHQTKHLIEDTQEAANPAWRLKVPTAAKPS